MSFYVAGISTGILFALMLAFILDILDSIKRTEKRARKNKVRKVEAKDIRIFDELYRKIEVVNVNEIN